MSLKSEPEKKIRDEGFSETALQSTNHVTDAAKAGSKVTNLNKPAKNHNIKESSGDRKEHKAIKKTTGAGRSLDKKEAPFRKITENMSDVIVTCDLEMNTTYITPSAAKLRGEPWEVTSKRKITDIYPPDTIKRFKQILKEELEKDNQPGIDKDRTRTVETELIRADGSTIYISNKLSFLRDTDGNPIGVQGIIRDVTDTVTAEKELRQAKEELERYFTISLDLLCIANTNGEFIRLNPEWEKILGYPVSELEGKSYFDYVHPEDLAATIEATATLRQQKEILNFVNRYRCRDGSYRWIEWRSKSQGETIYAAARDISDRKKTEENLSFQVSYQQLVSSIAGSFVDVRKDDLNSRLQKGMIQAAKLFKIDRCRLFSYLEKDKLFSLITEWSNPDITVQRGTESKHQQNEQPNETGAEKIESIPVSSSHRLFNQLKSKPYILIDETNMPADTLFPKNTGLCSDGESVLIFPMKVEKTLLGIISFSCVKRGSGWTQEVLLALGVIAKIFTDVMNRLRMEEEMLKMKQQAAAMAMVVTANHEINQPLMVIQGHVELLRIKLNNKEYDRHFKEVFKSIERIKNILQRMSKLKEIELTDYNQENDMVKLP